MNVHNLFDLPNWDYLTKQLIWDERGEISGKVLDFGSGRGETAVHLSKSCEVVAVEPSGKQLSKRVCPELELSGFYGLQTFFDLQQNQERHSDPEWQERILKLERRVSTLPEYQAVAFFHHMIFSKVQS